MLHGIELEKQVMVNTHKVQFIQTEQESKEAHLAQMKAFTKANQAPI